MAESIEMRERRGSGLGHRPSMGQLAGSPGRVPTSPRSPATFLRSLVRSPRVRPEEPVTPRPTRLQRTHSATSIASDLDAAYGDDADDFLAPDHLDDLLLGPPALDIPEGDLAAHGLEPVPSVTFPVLPTPERARRPSTVASKDTARTAITSRTAVTSRAMRMLRQITRADSPVDSTQSVPSSSSSSGSSSVRWRFWRGGSSSGSSGSRPSTELHMLVEPAFTLVVPDLSSAIQPFDRIQCPNMVSAIARLSEFWRARAQTDLEGADIGMHFAPTAARPAGRPEMPSRRATAVKPVPARAYDPNAPSWWLDVQCPTPRDLRALRRILPLHPLTMEDILQQDPREKAEVFDALGYHFVVFRAIDERVFQYRPSSPSSSDTLVPQPSPDGSVDSMRKDAFASEKDARDEAALGDLRRRSSSRDGGRGRVDIVVGSKEGVEGMTIGGVNVYLVILQDGIVSVRLQLQVCADSQFHFDPLDKHTTRVFEKIMHYGMSRTITPQWIAYGLMDSIVDAFFPMIEFVEAESNVIQDYLSDPLHTTHDPRPLSKPNSGLGRYRPTSEVVARVLPARMAAWLAQRRLHRMHKPVDYNKKARLAQQQYDRRQLLHKLSVTRQLVVALSRLLGSKVDAVRGLRKRVREGDYEDRVNDVSIYYGDLIGALRAFDGADRADHIMSMHQSLTYYDALLTHDHPVFTGILRISFERAKLQMDRQILRLYTVAIVFVPVAMLTGIFSENVRVPRNGDADHLDENGNHAGFSWCVALRSRC